jgi:ArsR family transcriptional regulator
MKKSKKQNKEVFERNAVIYKLLANPKRLEILSLLGEKEMTVTELVNAMDIRKANVSQHLAILRYLKFVTVKRIGKNAFYNIADKRITQQDKILDELWSSGHFNI